MKLFKMPEGKQELTLTNLFKLWRLNIKPISICVGTFIALSVAYTYVVPSTYLSYASIIPPDTGSSGGGLSSFLQSLSGGLSIGGLGSDNKVLLLGDFIKSREVAKYISDSLKLRSNPLFKDVEPELLYDIINKSIEIKVNRSGLIMLTAETGTPYFPNGDDMKMAAKLSADIANTAIAGLDYLSRSKSVSKAKRKRIYIERMLNEKKVLLDSIDNELEKFQKSNKVLAIDEQAKAILTASANIGSELGKAEAELAMKKFDFNSNSPSVKASEAAVQNIRNQYMRLQDGGLLGSNDYTFALSDMPKLFRKYVNLVRDKKIMEQINLYLETQRYQEAIQEQSDVPTIEPLDSAVVPLKRESPSRKLVAILALFLSTIFALTANTFSAIKNQQFTVRNSDAE